MRVADFPYRKEYSDHLLVERGVSVATVNGYGLDLELFFGHLAVQLQKEVAPGQIEPVHILGFLTHSARERGNVAKTRNRKLAALKSYFGYLERYGKLGGGENPVKRFQSVRTPKRLPVYFTEEEAAALLEAAAAFRYPARNVAMFRFFLQTGCRIGELLSLELSRLDLKGRTVRLIGKGNKERQVPLTERTCRALQEYLEVRRPVCANEPAVFLNKDGRAISRRGVQKLFERVCERAGLSRPGLSIHKLRHTCLTLLLQQGVDLVTLKQIAGHENISTTEIYLHVTQKEVRQAIEKHPLG